MTNILNEWRHISKGDMRRIIDGNARNWEIRWFNYHLSESGHNCVLCKKRLKEIKKPE
ncbi:MAG: hypothetical protein ACQEP3_00260 [Patescibacteria group bacterium]